jgi:hemerythrin-like domain-containing protein
MLVDHERLEELMNEVLDSFEENDWPTVADAWTRFDADLRAHLDAEERYLVPSLLRADEPVARGILEDHRQFRRRLLELGAGIDLHIVRLGAAKEFVDALRAHAQREDEKLYRFADEHVDEFERRSLLAALFGTVKRRLSALAS